MTSYLPENRGFRGFFDRFAPNICIWIRERKIGMARPVKQTPHDVITATTAPGPKALGPSWPGRRPWLPCCMGPWWPGLLIRRAGRVRRVLPITRVEGDGQATTAEGPGAVHHLSLSNPDFPCFMSQNFFGPPRGADMLLLSFKSPCL